MPILQHVTVGYPGGLQLLDRQGDHRRVVGGSDLPRAALGNWLPFHSAHVVATPDDRQRVVSRPQRGLCLAQGDVVVGGDVAAERPSEERRVNRGVGLFVGAAPGLEGLVHELGINGFALATCGSGS